MTQAFQIRHLIVFAAVAFSFAGRAGACEPVWVRPVHVARSTTIFLGRVEAVDWLRGQIIVTPIKTIAAIAGRPVRTTLHYNNIPLTCGSQSFWPGQQVYVIDAEWAAPRYEVTFDPPVR